MGIFTFKAPPERWEPRWLVDTLLALRLAVNTLAESNFPNRLNGDTLIKEKTLGLDRLKGPIRIGTLLALAVTFTTTSITLVQIGPMLAFDPLAWPSTPDRFFFEVTAGPSAATGSTVIELFDTTGVLATHTLTVIGQAYYSVALSRIPDGSFIRMRIRTTVATSTAGILGASVVYIP